jgi:hypothetical protein
MNDYKLGYTHFSKVLKVLDSCENLQQLNLAFDWYESIKHRFKMKESKSRKERNLMDNEIDQIFHNKKLYFKIR